VSRIFRRLEKSLKCTSRATANCP